MAPKLRSALVGVPGHQYVSKMIQVKNRDKMSWVAKVDWCIWTEKAGSCGSATVAQKQQIKNQHCIVIML